MREKDFEDLQEALCEALSDPAKVEMVRSCEDPNTLRALVCVLAGEVEYRLEQVEAARKAAAKEAEEPSVDVPGEGKDVSLGLRRARALRDVERKEEQLVALSAWLDALLEVENFLAERVRTKPNGWSGERSVTPLLERLGQFRGGVLVPGPVRVEAYGDLLAALGEGVAPPTATSGHAPSDEFRPHLEDAVSPSALDPPVANPTRLADLGTEGPPAASPRPQSGGAGPRGNSAERCAQAVEELRRLFVHRPRRRAAVRGTVALALLAFGLAQWRAHSAVQAFLTAHPGPSPGGALHLPERELARQAREAARFGLCPCATAARQRARDLELRARELELRTESRAWRWTRSLLEAAARKPESASAVDSALAAVASHSAAFPSHAKALGRAKDALLFASLRAQCHRTPPEDFEAFASKAEGALERIQQPNLRERARRLLERARAKALVTRWRRLREAVDERRRANDDEGALAVLETFLRREPHGLAGAWARKRRAELLERRLNLAVAARLARGETPEAIALLTAYLEAPPSPGAAQRARQRLKEVQAQEVAKAVHADLVAGRRDAAEAVLRAFLNSSPPPSPEVAERARYRLRELRERTGLEAFCELVVREKRTEALAALRDLLERDPTPATRAWAERTLLVLRCRLERPAFTAFRGAVEAESDPRAKLALARRYLERQPPEPYAECAQRIWKQAEERCLRLEKREFARLTDTLPEDLEGVRRLRKGLASFRERWPEGQHLAEARSLERQVQAFEAVLERCRATPWAQRDILRSVEAVLARGPTVFSDRLRELASAWKCLDVVLEVESLRVPARGDPFSAPDPYVEIRQGEVLLLRTRTLGNTLEGRFGERARFAFPLGATLRAEVYDADLTGAELLGRTNDFGLDALRKPIPVAGGLLRLRLVEVGPRFLLRKP